MNESVDIADGGAHHWRRQLTAYQRDLWMVAELFPGVPCYISGLAAHLVGDIDVDLLIECYRRAWHRHDGMRVRFGVCDGVPYQEFATQMPAIDHRDLSGHPDPAAAADAVIRASMDSPIDLRDGQVPLRLTLLRESATSYRVLLRSHHVATDATGLFILAAHILADYNIAATTGQSADVAGSSFLECIDRAHEYRTSEQWRADRDFLVEQAGDATAVLFDRPGMELAPVLRHRCELPRSFADRVRAAGLPFFPYLCTIVGTYLGAVLRTDDITVGIPLNNRPGAQMGVAGGHLANTLPLRIELGRHPRLTDLVADVRRRVQDTKVRQAFPLGDLMAELRRAGGDGGPLFDVTVNYLRLPQVAALSPIVASVDGLPQGSDVLTLAVHVHEFDEDGPMELIFDYATDVFDDDYPIETVQRQLETLLEAGLEALDDDPRTLSMISADEHDDLTDRHSHTAVPYDDSTSVIARILDLANRFPDLTALVAADTEPLTYAQLADRVDGLAAGLRQRGVGVGDRVGVVMERGPDLVVAVLAVLHTGAAYVPVDPRYPGERVSSVLWDADVAAVITDDDGRPGLTGFTLITPDLAAPSAGPGLASGHDLAYVIYTSGSTGKPKGVAVEHHSVINRLDWMQRRYPIGPGDVVLHKTSISFDVSVWELFWWAMQGATVALPAPGAERDPREILDAIAGWGVTVVHFVPSMLTPFLDLLATSPQAAGRAAGLRLVFCSGEALRPQHVIRFNRVFAHLGDRAPRLVNLYGPTEATVDVAYFDCPPDPQRAPRRVPIGRPIDNTRLYVLDGYGKPTPTGIPGELCIAGAGLARGYLNRPELDAECFVPDPFHPGQRMYRSGDLARRLADGQLEYLGRIDRQVKVRGNRVEPAEVEGAIAAVPGIVDAVVVADRSDDRGTRLIAFYVGELDRSTLRAQLAHRLPDYLLPAQLRRVTRIPLTASGKADRAALLADWRDSDGDPRPVQAHTDIEAALVAVWREVLDADSVSVHDNFFDLGGDSILTLRVRALAQARGIVLDTRDIARYPTVAELATHVVIGADPVPPVSPFELVTAVDRPRLGNIEDAYPLTRLQLGMLFHSTERDGSSTYHDVFRYSLRMPWQESAWRTALELAVARHPVLRTSFDLAGSSEPLQLVHHDADTHSEVIDLRDASAVEAEAVVGEHITKHRHHRYRFDRPGLYHFAVFLLADRVEVVFAFHHAILDGWSVSTLLAEILQDYRHLGGADIGPVSTEALPSFAEHVRAERRCVADPASRQYWTRILDGAPAVRIPGLRSHLPPAAGRPAPGTRIRHTVAVPAPLSAHAARVATTEHVPAKALYLAAHLITVGLFAGQRDVTCGVVTHGRPQRANAERTAGLFLNTVPLRIDTTAMTWRAVVHAAFERERANAAHSHYPLADLQRDADLAVEVAFNYVNFHRAGALLRATGVELLDVDIHEDTNFALLATVSRDPRDGAVSLRLDGDPALYTLDQLDQIASVYLTALHHICADPDGAIDFGAPTPAIAAPPATTGTVVSMFREQVRQHPDATALRSDDTTVTYRQLAAMADTVAAGLLAHGAGRGDRVALCAGRGPQQIAAVLGIALAGAACVPIDPAHPPARRAAILDQATPVAVIADGDLDTGRWARLSLPALLAAPAGAPQPLPAVHPDDTAYVLFTSGSTGQPKGVVMSHRGLANLVGWQLSVPSGWCARAGRAPSTLQFAPLSFDVAFQEIYSTLCGGGALVLVDEGLRRDLPALLTTLDKTGTERVLLPYVALQPLAEIAVARAAVPSALRIIVSSGEQLRVTDAIRRFCAAIDGVLLENQYGPTETHVVTYEPMTGDPWRFPDLPAAGIPIDNVAVVVLDDRQRPVPDGVPGEIWVGGAALADGYLGRPELTDAVFGTVAALGARLYRTGDLGRRLPDGRILIDGRRGAQVKVRGHRVEPREVELALSRAAADLPISDVAVIARPQAGNSSATTQLVAFLVGSADDAVTRRLRRAALDILPDHMVPARFEWLAELPRTASGKRADRTLAALPLTAPRPSHIAARDPHETVIAGLMADALGVARVGVFDDFFALGGDSLSALRLIVGIEQRFGVNVPMSALAAGPTVATLADRVRHRGAAAFDPVVALAPAGQRPPLFLVHPIGGTVLCYAGLARHLPAGQPLYALQAAGIEPGSSPTDSVSQMASDYLRAIQRVQPDGPYHIGGWSLGGLVAFEMARQLAECGTDLGSVVLIDTMTLRPDSPTDIGSRQLYSFFLAELLWATGGVDGAVEPLPAGVDSDEAALDFVLARAVEHGVLPDRGSRDVLRRLFDVFRACWRAGADYRPPRCDLDVTLLRAAEPLPAPLRAAHDAAGSRYGEAANGWDRYVGGRLEVIDVPGDHLSMVTEPHVADLAAALADHVGAQRDLEMTP